MVTGAVVAKMADLAAARADLEAAGARQRLIDEQKAIVRRKLDALTEERSNKGRGRPNTLHASKKAAAEHQMRRLERGLLPDENAAPTANRTDEETRTSAAQHPQHHAAAGTAPGGRPAADRAGGPRVGAATDTGSGGSGVRARARDRADAAGAAPGDDGEEDPALHHYYKVSPNQREFNESVASEYVSGERDRKLIKVEPYELIGGGCQQELIGLGSVHICAPHLHMGLPLPPCPRCEWKSVDEGKVHTRGWCPARRVYAQTVDEWLVGVQLTCDICEGEKREAEDRLAEMEEDDEMEGTRELQEARGEVAAATYWFR